LFGVAPAFYATRLEMAPCLRDGRGTTQVRSRRRLADGLIVGQISLSLVLLVGAGLFLRSLVNLTNIDTGFNRQNVLVTSLDPDGAGYQQDARWENVMERVEERVSGLPGVRAASFAFFVFNQGGWTDSVAVAGRPRDAHDPETDHNVVGWNYFEAMGMPILLGRGLRAEDSITSRRVAVINETMARTYFVGESPLGHTFSVSVDAGSENQDPEWRDIEVIGVVKDAKYLDLDEKSMPAAFYPHSQHARFLYQLVARYSGGPNSGDATFLAAAIKKAIGEIDPNLPVGDFTTLSQIVDDSMLNHRLVAQLCTFFGVLAALLACVGIYGLMSYGVERRTNEFGVRLALGADRRHVVWLVLRETLALVTVGIALGLGLALIASRFAESFLFELRAYDPLSIGAAMLAMIAVALFAGYLPAWRAAKVDPMVALRYE
jgi:predicted permease